MRGSVRMSPKSALFEYALIGLGANLSFRGMAPAETLLEACAALSALGRVSARSGLWRAPAWPDPARPAYVNAVAKLEVEASTDPAALLAGLHAIEARFGRARGEPNADRTLDLDLIDLGGRVSAEETSGPRGPRLPHPRAHERAFVLLPLRDVAPGWRRPGSGAGVGALIAALAPESLSGVERLAP